MKPRKSATAKRHDSGLRLLSYARVSDVRGREGPAFISEADQFARNRAYAEAYSHRIIEEGSDLDVSGGVMTRPTFDRFLDLIGSGKADGLIVAKLDRFARTNVGALAAVEKIEGAGGTLISVSEQIDSSTAAGRFLRTILFAAAEWERERIGEAWRTARASAVDRGIHVAPHVPPGYVRGPKATSEGEPDRPLLPHPVHAETIRAAYRMAVEGAPYAEIADYLNGRSLPSTSVKNGERATHWQNFRIRRLLANRAYLGEARSGPGMVNPAAHAALVDEETWLLAQRRRNGRQALRRPNRDRETPISILSGIARCAGCSFAMKPQEAGKTSPALYRCVKTSVHGRCPAPAVITKRRLEDYVLARFLERADAYLVGSPVADEDAQARQVEAEARTAERAYRAQLDNMDLRAEIGEEDHDRLIGNLYRRWQEAVAKADAVPVTTARALPGGVSVRELVERLLDESRNEALSTERRNESAERLRGLLHEGIEAIFVRPAASKARNAPVEGRVHIVFRGDEVIDLPRRGRRFEPRRYVW
jgi:DNA invertase Pin-like site-specific DNA recombinase